jgi:hypothetical protein
MVMAVRAYYGWKIRRTDKSSWSVEKEAAERGGVGVFFFDSLGFSTRWLPFSFMQSTLRGWVRLRFPCRLGLDGWE